MINLRIIDNLLLHKNRIFFLILNIKIEYFFIIYIKLEYLKKRTKKDKQTNKKNSLHISTKKRKLL